MLRQVFVLLALCLCLSFVQADYSPITVNSPDFQVVVQTSVGLPQWLFNQNDNTTYVYKVTLVGLWETENSTYDLVANTYVEPRSGWMVQKGELQNNSQSVSVSTQPGTNLRWDSLALNTHVPMGAVNGSSYPAGKFDVEITNYKWVSLSESAQLVLAFSLDYEVDQKTPAMGNLTTHGSRTVDFSGAYFSINSTAMGGPKTNTSISVSVKTARDVPSQVPSFYSHNAYVIYDHFDTSLKHDPEFGFGEGPGNNYIWIIIIVVVVIAIIVIILIAVIGFILVRRRRRSYDAF